MKTEKPIPRPKLVRLPKRLSNNENCLALVHARVDQRITRDLMAARVGVVKSTIRAWETGKCDPFINVQAWANALGYDLVLVPKQTHNPKES